MRERVWKDNKGFTLIEIVITAVVLATISVPLLAYFSDSMRHSALTKEQQNAVVAAQDAVEELKVAGYSLDADKVVEPSAAPFYDWTFPNPMPTGSGVSYEMYKNYTVNGKSYNVVAEITPKSSVSGVYNSSSDAYDKDLDFSEAMVPSMDSTKDIISTESKDYLGSAAFKYQTLYANYCKNSNGAVVEDTTKVNIDTITAHLERKINVTFEEASSDDKISVTVEYEYSYNKDSTDEYPQAVLDTNPTYTQMVITKALKKDTMNNVFIFYKPDKHSDKISISSSKPASVLGLSDLKLYIIAESSVAQLNATLEDESDTSIVIRDMGYQMQADCDSNMLGAFTEVYTNLVNDSMDEFSTSSNMYAIVKKDLSGKYTLITRKNFNRLADITVTVYRDNGGSYPFDASDKLAEVDGNKVQK